MDYKSAQIIIKENTAIIRVNPPPLNQVSELFIDEMSDILNSAFENDEVSAIILTGTGKKFIAGMDIESIRVMKDTDVCLYKIMKIHEFLNRIEQGPKPVIAAINGHCTRGGLEIAMACHYRIAAKGTRLGMLDIRFGLIPFMGGTQRLPRLIGVKSALAMITGAQDVSAEQAKVQNLIDDIADSKEIIDKAMDAARRFISGRINFKMRLTSKRFDNLLDSKEKKEIVKLFSERLKETAGGYIAPFKAIQAIDQGLGINFKSDIKMEAGLFCDCAFSDISKNLIDIFLNTRKAGNLTRIKGEKIREIRKIAIMGSGTMGSCITAFLLKNGFEVWLWDMNRKALEKGLDSLRKIFARSIKNREISKENLEHMLTRQLHPVTVFESMKNVDMVIESISEDIEEKQKICKYMEGVCRRDTIFSSTTSSLEISEIASVLENPGRMIGLHFFNPADKIQLLEISCSSITADDIVATAVDFTRRIRKIPFVVNDAPGCYVSRQIFSLISESCFLISEGVNPFSIEKAVTEFGMPIGPARLSDLTGIDIIYTANRYLESALEESWPVPPIFKLLYDTGCYGRKTGSGWYDYNTGTQALNLKFMEVVKNYLKENKISPQNMPREEILEQIIVRSVNEGARAVQEGISNHIIDMDIAMVYGTGFPPHRGGIFRYADTWGISNVYNTLLKLEASKGPRFKPVDLLREMAETGKTFYKD